ncbi:hypothetical protein LSH36_17g12006 [Paralvinella palmiformis]|uniref:Uncharacterized protein n=1 Tax=Paralvinella palmiformis TaxID=53620 RepID=A0AAD9KB37_9ANNE|nr:hypothetical protein LSH36_17g12006 [Paralvinella palmiformis]
MLLFGGGGDLMKHLSTRLSDLQWSALSFALRANSSQISSDVKQLKWEMERDRWMSGNDWKTKRRAKRYTRGGKQSRGLDGKLSGRQDRKGGRFKGREKRKRKNLR